MSQKALPECDLANFQQGAAFLDRLLESPSSLGWFIIGTIAHFAYYTGITNHFHLTKSVGNDVLKSGKADPWSVLTTRYGLALTAVLEADSASAAEH